MIVPESRIARNTPERLATTYTVQPSRNQIKKPSTCTCTSTTTCTYFVDVDVHVLVDGCCHLQICFQKVKDFRPSNTNGQSLRHSGRRFGVQPSGCTRADYDREILQKSAASGTIPGIRAKSEFLTRRRIMKLSFRSALFHLGLTLLFLLTLQSPSLKGQAGSKGKGLPHAAPATVGLWPANLKNIDEAVRAAIKAKETPGAVVLVGRRGKIAYLKAFGHRALEPLMEPMSTDT